MVETQAAEDVFPIACVSTGNGSSLCPHKLMGRLFLHHFAVGAAYFWYFVFKIAFLIQQYRNYTY